MLKIYAILDSKAAAFGNPFYMRSIGEAVRAFNDEAKKENSMVKNYPEDFTLFELGDYDQVTGIIKPLQAPKSIGNAVSLQ